MRTLPHASVVSLHLWRRILGPQSLWELIMAFLPRQLLTVTPLRQSTRVFCLVLRLYCVALLPVSILTRFCSYQAGLSARTHCSQTSLPLLGFPRFLSSPLQPSSLKLAPGPLLCAEWPGLQPAKRKPPLLQRTAGLTHGRPLAASQPSGVLCLPPDLT